MDATRIKSPPPSLHVAMLSSRKHQACLPLQASNNQSGEPNFRRNHLNLVTYVWEHENKTESHRISMDSSIHKLILSEPLLRMMLNSAIQIYIHDEMSKSGSVRQLKVPVSNRFPQKSEHRNTEMATQAEYGIRGDHQAPIAMNHRTIRPRQISVVIGIYPTDLSSSIHHRLALKILRELNSYLSEHDLPP